MNRTEDIDSALATLANAVASGENANPHEIMGPVTILLGGALIDLNRIANAVEKLSRFEITKVGEVLMGSSDGLTVEERQTIEALRRGDIQVVSTPPKPERPWTEWHGILEHPFDISADDIVDVRFREPTAGDRAPDLLGVRADSVGWINTGRPTNADVVAYRLTDKSVVE